VNGLEVQVINTHFGLFRAERRRQATTILGPEWLGDPGCSSPRILLGDFNAVPRSNAYRLLARRMQDAFHGAGPRRRRATFPAPVPMLRIDHIFLEKAIEVVDVRVHRTRLSRVASDHLPVVADLLLPGSD
jgi:endonuclease/exonuclease/phosphatase family metal-dependent hydrolase